jgi:hypothetical protein
LHHTANRCFELCLVMIVESSYIIQLPTEDPKKKGKKQSIDHSNRGDAAGSVHGSVCRSLRLATSNVRDDRSLFHELHPTSLTIDYRSRSGWLPLRRHRGNEREASTSEVRPSGLDAAIEAGNENDGTITHTSISASSRLAASAISCRPPWHCVPLTRECAVLRMKGRVNRSRFSAHHFKDLRFF